MGSNLSTSLLLAALVLLPLLAVPIHCGYRRIEVDHFATFSLGFLFYWVLPIVVGTTGILRENLEMKRWYMLFDVIDNRNLLTFLIVALSCYGAFLMGTYIGGRVRLGRSGRAPEIHFNRRWLKIVLSVVSLLVVALAFALRDKFLAPYRPVLTMEDMDLWHSAYEAACSVLIGLLLFDCATRNRLAPSPLLFRGTWPNRFFLVYFAAGIFSLAMGTRLYFVSGLLMLCVYRSVFLQKFRQVGLLSVVGCGLLLAGSIGVWRMRFSHNSMNIGLSISLESLFTSFSLISFLSTYRIPLVRYPIELLSNLVALVPSFLWPHKWDLFVSEEDLGYVVFAPVGAYNSFVSFMVNFGALGTIAVMFLMGLGMMRLKIAAKSPLSRVVYTMISGWFALSFFRDPFYISVIKSILEFSILVPLTLAVTLHLLSRNWVLTPTMQAPPLPQPE